MGSTCTDFLSSSSSFLSGWATIANLPGNFYRYNVAATPAEADARALRSDFAMVGQDLREAVQRFKATAPGQMEFQLR